MASASRPGRVVTRGAAALAAAVFPLALTGCGPEEPAPGVEPGGLLPTDLLRSVQLPIECGDVGVVKVIDERFDFDGDTSTDSILAVRCDAGAGSPPTGVYAVQAAADGPKVVGTLVSTEEGVVIQSITPAADGIRLLALGYSEGVPRCCPDLEVSYRFQWNGTTFERLEREERPASPAPEPPPPVT